MQSVLVLQEYPEMKSQCLDIDRISTFPGPIIEDILCRLDKIQEGARTCILSREWRYKWANVPKLNFNESMFQVSTYENQLSILNQTFGGSVLRKLLSKRFKFLHAIYQVLLLHQGPIHEFTLTMDGDNTCIEIDHIIIHLSRNNALKKFTLIYIDPQDQYRLPLSIFSLHHLTHLYLYDCQLDHTPILNGFCNLTSLYLRLVCISTKTLLHLLSACPLLKRFSLFVDDTSIIRNDNDNDNSTITELLQCLPLIEHLSILHWIIWCIAQDGIPKVLPTKLVHLNFFYIEDLHVIDEYGLPFVLLVIRSSPNLEKLITKMYYDPDAEDEIGTLTLENLDYSGIWLENLKELVIGDFVNLKHSMEFVKLILAKSPMLKKVSIYVSDEVTKSEKMLISSTILRSPHASYVVEIIVE